MRARGRPPGPGAPARGALWRVATLVALVTLAAGAAFSFPPIAQDPAYHGFADRRRLWSLPNALNVLSNAPFVVIGALGLRRIVGGARRAVWERAALVVLFAGVGLTGVGSAWYHAAPTTASLFWDRLPMTLALMPLLALVLGERVSERSGPWLLAACLAAGIGSVVSWRLGEASGAGDLRFYALVQLVPMLVIPAALALFPHRWIRGRHLLAAVGWYALAKLFEALDAPIFALGGVVSGHTLKHLCAATAAGCLLGVAASWRDRPPAGPVPV